MADLQLRKQSLLIESEVNRLALRVEWHHVVAATGWMSQAARFCREANPWLLLLAPLAGAWTARTLRREGGLLNSVLAALKWIPPLLTVWRNLAGTPGQPASSVAQPPPDARP